MVALFNLFATGLSAKTTDVDGCACAFSAEPKLPGANVLESNHL